MKQSTVKDEVGIRVVATNDASEGFRSGANSRKRQHKLGDPVRYYLRINNVLCIKRDLRNAVLVT